MLIPQPKGEGNRRGEMGGGGGDGGGAMQRGQDGSDQSRSKGYTDFTGVDVRG